MITVDIVSPVGGRGGGIENVIRSWTEYIDEDKVNLRVFHLHAGMAYLNGYPKAYCIDQPFEKADLGHLVRGYELFLQEHGEPEVCIATNWPMMTLACAIVRQRSGRSMKIVSWVHNQIEMYERENLGGVTEMTNADAHFAINRRIGEQVHAADPGARVYEIGNPVELPESGNRSDGKADPYQLCYVGRLSYIKHVDIILEALYRAKGPWKLTIVGDGEIRKEVEGWIKLLGLSGRVVMSGWQTEPWAECEDAGILVMASEYEGFPMVACEASARGKTVISTPIAGLDDYITEGRNGYFYPFEDAAALAGVLDRIETGELVRCDPAVCRESVKPYSTENYYKQVMRALEELAAE